MGLTFQRTEKVTGPEADIRHTVFEAEQGFVDEFDEIDNRSIHILASQDSKAVGVCRIFTEDDPNVYFLGRLAVIKSCRKDGVGSALVQEAEKAALENHAGQIRLHAQLQAKPFYEKCGYHQEGGLEEEQGCPHVWMVKDLQK